MNTTALLKNIRRIADDLEVEIDNAEDGSGDGWEVDLHTLGARLIAQGEMATGGLVE